MKEYTSQPQPVDLNEHEFKVIMVILAKIYLIHNGVT